MRTYSNWLDSLSKRHPTPKGPASEISPSPPHNTADPHNPHPPNPAYTSRTSPAPQQSPSPLPHHTDNSSSAAQARLPALTPHGPSLHSRRALAAGLPAH